MHFSGTTFILHILNLPGRGCSIWQQWKILRGSIWLQKSVSCCMPNCDPDNNRLPTLKMFSLTAYFPCYILVSHTCLFMHKKISLTTSSLSLLLRMFSRLSAKCALHFPCWVQTVRGSVPYIWMNKLYLQLNKILVFLFKGKRLYHIMRLHAGPMSWNMQEIHQCY